MNNFANSTKKSIFAILVLFSAKDPFSKQKFKSNLLKWWKQILVAKSWTRPRTPIACNKMSWEKEWNFYIIKKSLCECINEIVENTSKKLQKRLEVVLKGSLLLDIVSVTNFSPMMVSQTEKNIIQLNENSILDNFFAILIVGNTDHYYIACETFI